jgi:S1-C subfamily serine protease
MMSENEKDNNNFEFIKEQVIEKKRKKIKKRLLPLLTLVFMAILFGLIAAVTFVAAEPKLYKFLHKDDTVKTPVSFPTQIPDNPDTEDPDNSGNEGDGSGSGDQTDSDENQEPVILEQTIDADLDDYMSMNNEIRKVAYEVDKSLLRVRSTFNVTDTWFGKSVEKTVDTTGVIIYNNTKELLIVVSYDRIKNSNGIKVVFSDTKSVEAKLQDYESDINLAIVAVAIEDIPDVYMTSLQVAKLGNSNALSVGTPIIALGSPNGHLDSMEFGYITSKGSYSSITDNRLDLFNTSIEDNEDSDGIIVNLNGELIGLITRTLKDDVNKNLNTAIGISRVKPIIENMGNQIPRVYFGINAEDMTESAKKEHNITYGIYVDEVQPKSPAFTSGMKNGDIILDVNDSAILDTNNFYNTITKYKQGDELTVKIKRTNGTTEKELELKVVLKEKDN